MVHDGGDVKGRGVESAWLVVSVPFLFDDEAKVVVVMVKVM